MANKNSLIFTGKFRSNKSNTCIIQKKRPSIFRRYRSFTYFIDHYTVVVVGNPGQAIQVAKDLVQNKGIESITLCPGFTHESVAGIANAVGQGVGVTVARGDPPSSQATSRHLAKKGWFSPPLWKS